MKDIKLHFVSGELVFDKKQQGFVNQGLLISILKKPSFSQKIKRKIKHIKHKIFSTKYF